MPIAGYFGPNLYNMCWNGNELPDYFSDEIFQKLSDLGLNIFTKCEIVSADRPAATYKLLEMAQKYNIGAMPLNSYAKTSPTAFGKSVCELMQYDSWSGVYLVDEPTTSYFYAHVSNPRIETYKEYANLIHNEMDLFSFGNLFPMGSLKKKSEFEKYVKEWIDTANPKVIMKDEYPFNLSYKGNMAPYIVSTSIMNKYAQENDIAFWNFIQAGDHMYQGGKPTLPYWPNEAQFDWLISTSLAYGAQGIIYYPIFETRGSSLDDQENVDPYRNGFLGVAGNKTLWYHYGQEIHKHIREIDHVLMNSVHKGVIIKGEQAQIDFKEAYGVLKGEEFNELQAVYGHDAMIGCFNYNGNTALYVVNYNQKYAQRITLDFDAKHNITITQSADTAYVRGDSLTLDMAAGEGVLLVIE